MAERVGFEPTVRFPVRSLSRRVLSTAQSPLRGCCSFIVAKPFLVPPSPRKLPVPPLAHSFFEVLNAAPRKTLVAPLPILPQTHPPSHLLDDSSSSSSTARTRTGTRRPSDRRRRTQLSARV